MAIEIVSTNANGDEGNSASQLGDGFIVRHGVSQDGRLVVFQSAATDLVDGDSNGRHDIFVKDTLTGAIQRVSTTSAGAQVNGTSSNPVISADGTHVAFFSDANNLVAGDTNAQFDIFVKDLDTGAIERVSTSSSGAQANQSSRTPSLSADGRFVAFTSDASNLVSGDGNIWADIFVKDMVTGETVRASQNAAGEDANYSSTNASISADGRYVVFSSFASNLVEGDTNARTDIFVKDLQTGGIVLVSTDSAGAQANGESYSPDISADGRYVVFQSGATNLVAGDTNNNGYDIFVKDLVTGETIRASATSSGGASNGASYTPSISADGRFVAFDSSATNLAPGDSAISKIFIKDMVTGEIVRVTPAGASGYSASLSGDGSAVGFMSASAIDPGDGNSAFDVYKADNEMHEPATLAGASQDWLHSLTLDVVAAQSDATVCVLANGDGSHTVLQGSGFTYDPGSGRLLTGAIDAIEYRLADGTTDLRVVPADGAAFPSVEQLIADIVGPIETARASLPWFAVIAQPLSEPLLADGAQLVLENTDGTLTVVQGNGFTYAPSGRPDGGTVTGIAHTTAGGVPIDFVPLANEPLMDVAQALLDHFYAEAIFGYLAEGGVTVTDEHVSDGNFVWMFGGEGDDSFIGGLMSDGVSYAAANGPVNVDLAAGTASGQGNDFLSDIERIEGSDYGDVIAGRLGDEYLDGQEGDDQISGGDGPDSDVIVGGEGDDTLDGGVGGVDFVSYATSPSGVTVDLAAGTASGGQGNDTLTGFEGIFGSGFDDVLGGDGGDNILIGGAGVDALQGQGGKDRFIVNPGDLESGETYDGGADGDTLDLAGNGIFDLAGVTLTSIEAIEMTGSAGTRLILSDNAQAGLVSLASGAADRVDLASAIRADLYDQSGVAVLLSLLGAGVEEIVWADAGWGGDSVVTPNGDGTFNVVSTDTTGQNWSTRTTQFDASGTILSELRQLDDGRTATTSWEAGVKAGYELVDVDDDFTTFQSQEKAFHANGRVATFQTVFDPGGSMVSQTVSYDDTGLRTAFAQELPDGRVVTLAYDALGKVTSRLVEDIDEAYAWTSKLIEYDALGNAVSKRDVYDSGNIIAQGGAGNDLVSGGDFSDTLWGLGGADDFVFTGGYDSIRDFSLAEGDRLDLTAFGIDSLASFTATAIVTETAAALFANLGAGDVLRIDGLTLAQLDDGDFVGFGL